MAELTLGLDTSGPYCGMAVFDGAQVLAARHEEMRKGQAEVLMPLLEETLADAGCSYADLAALAVGTGPGNFTGIRIAVSATRGLSLALGIPARGVTLFEALSMGAPLPILASLEAPRGALYLSQITAQRATEPLLSELPDIPAPGPGFTCVGHRSDEVAAHLGLRHAPAAFAPASAVARFSAAQSGPPDARPAPYYLRAPDAAPPRDPAPVILP